MKKLILGAVLLSLGGLAEAHDCRIKRIDLKAYRKADTLTIKALYYAYDGTTLNPRLCPDQNGPTWSFSENVENDKLEFNPDGYSVTIPELQPWTIVAAYIATIQRPDSSFTALKRWCIDCR